jgi:hypothetical protein
MVIKKNQRENIRVHVYYMRIEKRKKKKKGVLTSERKKTDL